MAPTRCTALAALGLALLTFAAPAQGQEQPPRGEERREGEQEEEERPGARGGFGEGFAEQAVSFLKRELDLDPTQEVQVRMIMEDVIERAWSRMSDMFRGGFGPDALTPEAQEKARTAFEDVRLETAKRIGEVLSPAQKREFEVLLDQFDRRAQRFEQGRRAWEDPSELFNPAPPSKRLMLAKAERALFLGPEETAVILPFIERVLDARQALYEGRKVRRRDLLNATRAGAAQDEIAERLATIRAAEQFQQLELFAAQQALRELLTIEQEARLVAMDVLD